MRKIHTAVESRGAPGMPDLRRIEQMRDRAPDVAAFLKALGNEQRLLILCKLLEQRLSVGDLNEKVELSQSALSQHLAVLRDAGFVESRRESQSIFYSVTPGPVTRVMAVLQEVFCPPPGRRDP